jgi:hypothetical protein
VVLVSFTSTSLSMDMLVFPSGGPLELPPAAAGTAVQNLP